MTTTTTARPRLPRPPGETRPPPPRPTAPAHDFLVLGPRPDLTPQLRLGFIPSSRPMR